MDPIITFAFMNWAVQPCETFLVNVMDFSCPLTDNTVRTTLPPRSASVTTMEKSKPEPGNYSGWSPRYVL